MKAKLTTMEKRAKAACERIRKSGTGGIAIEWRRSPAWGRCAAAIFGGSCGKAAHASGHGYCKGSAALANALRFLGANEVDVARIWAAGGAGVSTVQRRMADCGWALESVGRGTTWDAYTIKRKESA